MNNENFQYLKDHIKYNGFGENLYAALEENIKEGKTVFCLHYSARINNKLFEAILNFRKSDTLDRYFFNSYHAMLERRNGQKTEQTFYVSRIGGITCKEAFNLLDGRAVYKEVLSKEEQPYKTWLQLDFNSKDRYDNFEVKKYYDNYGFDLKTALEQFGIIDGNDPEKEKVLMQSLQRGNIQSVTIEMEGVNHKMFIEADPQYKKLNLYDSQMKLVPKESLDQFKSVGPKVNPASEELEFKKAVDSEERTEKISNKTKLPKKKEKSKKGMSAS